MEFLKQPNPRSEAGDRQLEETVNGILNDILLSTTVLYFTEKAARSRMLINVREQITSYRPKKRPCIRVACVSINS